MKAKRKGWKRARPKKTENGFKVGISEEYLV
jgi:hypothetical protein